MADSERNRRSVVVGAQRSIVVDEAVPECGSGQVLIRVLVSGVCASELGEWTSGPSGDRLYLGHEPVGTVAAVGPAVEGVSVGDRVTGRVEPAFGDYAVADLVDVVQVPTGLAPVAGLGEPIGCVVEALRRTPSVAGRPVAVVGLGFMGLVLLQLLRAEGADKVLALDPRPDAREHALAHGADRAADPTDIDEESAYPTVFEVSGSQPGLDLASRLVAEHGTLSIVGYHRGRRTVDMEAWNDKALDVVNGHVRDRDRLRESTERGLAMAASGRVDIAALVTHRFPLDRVDDAFAALAEKPPGFVKAVIDLV